MITALGPVAADLGANRVIKGVKIPHPCGDPTLEPSGDHALRVRIVSRALESLGTKIDKATIFDGAAS